MIGLVGLLIGLTGIYDILKEKRSLQAIRSIGSFIGLALVLISAGVYWYIFRDLFWSFSVIGRIPSIFSQIFPWQFVVPFAVGLVILVLSIVKYYRESRMSRHVTKLV